jgi:putative membrane protein
VRTRLRWAALAAVLLTAWDVSMDPAMVATTHWVWQLRPLTGMSTFERIVHGGHYYGMPLTNWMGWLLTGFVVAFAMLSLVRPTEWAARVSPTRFPLALYAINGVLPVAICVGRGMTWAVVAGVIAMAVPLVLAMHSRRVDRETEARAPGVESRDSAAVALSGH